MNRWIDIVIVILSGIVSVGFTTWRLERLTRRSFKTFHERVEQQEKTLAVMSSEVQFARSEVARLQSELTAMRFAMESFLEGPPSMRRPPRVAS